MDDIDFYDVQAMIRDARSEISGEIANAQRDLRSQISELEKEIDRLRYEVAAASHILNLRTEHLV